MQHSIPSVAEARFLPEQELIDFANANEAKYGIYKAQYCGKEQPWVSTWHVDALVQDFRAQNEALCERVRAEKVAALRA